MFPLCRTEFPKDELELKSAIGAGLGPLGLDASRVTVDGALPALAELRCDVSGSEFRKEHRFAVATGAVSPGFFARKVSVLCENGRFSGAGFSASLRMDDAVFGYGRDAVGGAVLMLERCGSAVLDVSVHRSGLERMLFDLAAAAAEEQGAEMKGMSLYWEQQNPQAVTFRIEARAKAMFVETRVSATGRVAIDDAMQITISGLTVSGEGMMGNLAATMLRKEIPKYEGRSFSLGGILPGGLRLKSIALRCEPEALSVHATA